MWLNENDPPSSINDSGVAILAMSLTDFSINVGRVMSVSYTHLTLPTILRV